MFGKMEFFNNLNDGAIEKYVNSCRRLEQTLTIVIIIVHLSFDNPLLKNISPAAAVFDLINAHAPISAHQVLYWFPIISVMQFHYKFGFGSTVAQW